MARPPRLPKPPKYQTVEQLRTAWEICSARIEVYKSHLERIEKEHSTIEDEINEIDVSITSLQEKHDLTKEQILDPLAVEFDIE